MTDIAAGLNEVRDRIRSARIRAGRVDRVHLVAVTKNHPADAVEEAVRLGVEHVGENRVQEALQKQQEYKGGKVHWHMIGHLQRNKARDAVRYFDLIHSVDSERLLTEIEKQAARHEKKQDILLQFNIAEEENKYGLRLGEFDHIVRVLQDTSHVRLCGLMCMAPFYDDPELTRPVFRVAYHVFDELKKYFPAEEIKYLSMGMSNDFEVAIEEGANMVRVGTSIFGA